MSLRVWFSLVGLLAVACGDSDASGGSGGSGGSPEVPFGSCDAATATVVGRDAPIACAPSPATWCDAPCPLEEQTTLQCNGSQVAVGADGSVFLLADSFEGDKAPTLIEMSTLSEQSLPAMNVATLLFVGDDGTPRVFHSTESPNARLLQRRIADGTDEAIACLDGEAGFWVPRGAAQHEGTVRLLARWGADGPSGLVLATAEDGAWTAEDAAFHEANGESLTMADTGAPILGAFLPSDGWEAHVGVAMGPAEGLPFVVDGGGERPFRVIPGESSWEAIGWAKAEGFQVGRPDGTIHVVAETGWLASSGCAAQEAACSGACTVTGTGGLERTYSVVRDGDALLVFFLELTLNLETHFEGEPCADAGAGDGAGAVPGCSCERVVDADTSTGAIVGVRVDLATGAAETVLRAPVGPANEWTSLTVARGGARVAFLLNRNVPDVEPSVFGTLTLEQLR